MEKKSPDLPRVFSTAVGKGPSGLIPPSHFETRRRLSVPPPPVVIPPPPPPPPVYEPWADVAGELAELRKENEELKKRWARGDATRARSLDRHQPTAPPAESQALEIISQQMQEIRRLELAVADAHEKEEKMARLAQETQELRRALRDSKEAEEKQRLSADLASRQQQEELLMMSERHKAEAETLKSRLLALEAELKAGRETQQQEMTRLRGDLQTANQERERLTEQLSQSHLELDSQNSLVQQLRTYIGELVPDNRRLEEQKRERAELQNTIETLEKERDTLQTSVSLLHTRLSSLTNILSLQESELCKKGAHGDAEKSRLLLSRWREKVFSLMVQMKSEEINKENDSRRIREKILSLERSLEESNQKQILAAHSLQDRTAELEMEKVRSKSLQDELSAAQSTCDLMGLRAEKAEKTVLRLKEMVDMFAQVMSRQEETLKTALSRLVTLSQRVSFATKRVDATQGLIAQRLALEKLSHVEKPKDAAAETDICRPSYEDLEVEVKFLHGERDRLSMELKRSALLIEGRVREARETVEAELAESRHAASLLRQSLSEREESEQELRYQLQEMERRQQEASGDAAQLREQLRRQQGEYETELQRKVNDVEEKMTRRLTQMEKHLQEARREHTKAVVALRQAERQMQRDKARSQETLRTVEDAARTREEQLSQQLRQAERDKNLMTATLRQEGLFATYQRNRAAAVQPPQSQEDERRAAGAPGRSSAPACKESISAMLANLQSLGNTLLKEEEDDDDEEEEVKVNP